MYPTESVTITCSYGYPGKMWAAGYHTGTDFRASVGTPLYAAKGGKVVHVGWGGWGTAYGYHVIISCRTSVGSYRRCIYAHMTSSPLRYGQIVKAGQYIGRSGSTGHTFGPHLHYEERVSPFGYWQHRRPIFLSYKPIIKPTVSLRKVKPGKTNRHIKKVQRHLNRRLGGNDLPVTGFYGPMTKRHYKRWQERLGYGGSDADGIAGRNSLERLGFRVVP